MKIVIVKSINVISGAQKCPKINRTAVSMSQSVQELSEELVFSDTHQH